MHVPTLYMCTYKHAHKRDKKTSANNLKVLHAITTVRTLVSSNQVGNVVVLFYFSNLGEEEEAEAGYRRKVMSVHHATKRQQA